MDTIKQRINQNIETRIALCNKNDAYIEIMDEFKKNQEIWSYCYNKVRQNHKILNDLMEEYEKLVKERKNYE